MDELKPKLAKSDYMLLFVRINKIRDDYIVKKDEVWRIFDFEHVQNRFQPMDHAYSPDKRAHPHCYDMLEVGHFYVIFAHRAAEVDHTRGGKTYSRWIWRSAVEMSEKNIRLAYAFYLKNAEEPKLVGQFVDQLNNPRLTPSINEFDYA